MSKIDELQKRVDELQSELSELKEKEKKFYPASSDDIQGNGILGFCYPTSFNDLDVSADFPEADRYYHTEKHAKSAIAFWKLSHLLKAYNGDWVADWVKGNEPKHIIRVYKDELVTGHIYCVRHFLAFPDAEKRDHFFKHHEQLIKDYFML